MKLDHKKYTVSAVLIALVLLLFAGTVMAQPVITTFQPDTKTAAAGETVTWTATSPTGVSYAFYIMKRGDGADQRVHMQWYGPSNTVSYKFLEDGTYYARVFVKDAQDKLTWQDTLSHWDVAVSGESVKLGIVFEEQPSSGTTDQPMTYKVKATGGEVPYQYAFYVFKDGSRVHTKWYNDSPEFIYTPVEPGNYKVQGFVKDATGKIEWDLSNEIVVTGVSTELKITEISGSADDGTITWNVTAVGGTEPYQYAFYVFKDGTRVDMQWYGAASTFTYKPKDAGSYQAQAFVKDGTGKIVHYTQKDMIPIDEGSAALGASVANPDPLGDVGSKKTWTATAVGGEAPYEYAFYVYEGGIRVHTQWYSASDSIIYTPTKTATDYYVRAFVKDADGAIAIADSAKVKFGGTTVDPFGITAVTLTSHSLVDFTEPWVWEVTHPDNHDGQGPISYCYYVYKDGTRIAMEWYKEGADTFSYTPKEIGNYSVRAFAKDTTSKIVYKDSEAQETRLYHYYFTFSSEGNDKSNEHGYVMASGFPVLKYNNYADSLAHRGYSNHTSRSTVQVTLGENTVYLSEPTEHQLKWIKNDARIQYNSANKKVYTTTELTKENYYKVVDFNNSEGVCSFKLLEDDGVTPVEFTADETKTYEFRYVSNNQDRVSYNAQNGILTLGTMADGAVGSGPYTWTCATGKEIRFAGLRPGIPDKPGGVAVEPKARVEFWQYMIAPNLPYAEVKFKNITSSETGQEARFNFDWLINKPKNPVASGYDPYEQRIGLGISADGKLYVMDSKGGKYTADDANYFNWYDLQQTAADFENNDWNTVRLQVLANGSVEMLLNGNLVYTSATGYYNVADARRGAITLEVLQVAPAGTESDNVGNASVELSDYSFGINRLVELGPSYE